MKYHPDSNSGSPGAEERFKENPESGLYEGYTDNYLKVVFPAEESMVGEIVRVKITEPGYPYSKGQFVRVMDIDEEAFV